ncbi:hypothetical protein A2473_01665 [candidate division WWE3 bacterium RIFOXYC2_FULL_42_13]|uniref:Uncharacterized protein n=2 Tax=Katanobacteria TaxID=422282 RepID=A0A0G1ENI5_UNCKA|nr:MAG: hypothetical protein UV89_C0012G0005 [candidate division WWE3 bacterium GW2011_GWB2_43_22]OGC59059.1 MAG: hypothetical protein A2245_01925 [candidate division WWE3 bacterium RIFOXYA2_FULL_43_12]OGC66681.1 MAG: hypothetical protein A2274_02580 [candidate division WWE3 bacterium RIFOXYA12_FULL_43_11]OGC72405.1 MAG: hypothetical protein A2337_02600 [candidate division WWE3 bacterium RIFOXYB2_FULL_43_9]OGC73707.1 MAG: hypothetical protein A2473_01665 [candidate division WWE3 bacterium RIFOX
MQLLKDIYNNAEALKGRKLITVTIVLSIVFLGIGIFIGYLNNLILKKGEISSETVLPPPVADTTIVLEGRVAYTNPEYYPGDEISYVLTDASGKEISLLKAEDDKLALAEGLNVKVRGDEMRTESGTKYLMVREVIINAAN